MTRTDYIAFLEGRQRMLKEFSCYCTSFMNQNGTVEEITEREDGMRDQMVKLLNKLIEAHEVSIAISFKTRSDRIAEGDFEQAELSFGANVPKPLWYVRELEHRGEPAGSDRENAQAREDAEKDPLFQAAEEAQTAALEAEVEKMVGPVPKRVIDECQADIERRKAAKK